MSRYQKGKTNLDFTEARDSEWQWHQLEHMQVCTSLQTDNHASTSPLSFLQAGCPPCRPTNSVKALKATLPPGVENNNNNKSTGRLVFVRSEAVVGAGEGGRLVVDVDHGHGDDGRRRPRHRATAVPGHHHQLDARRRLVVQRLAGADHPRHRVDVGVPRLGQRVPHLHTSRVRVQLTRFYIPSW